MRSTRRSSARRTHTRASSRSTPRRHRSCPGSRSSPPPTSTSARSSRRRSRASTQRMGRPYLAGDVVRFVGRHRRGRPHRDARRRVSTPPSSSSSTTTRCLSSSIPARRSRGTCSSIPSSGTNVCTSHPVERDEALFDGCDVVVSGSLVSQRLAACPLESRACAAVVRRRRAADALALDADAAPGPRRPRGDPRPRARAGARRRTRRRWRLRREGPERRGRPRVLAGAQDRAPGPLDRDAQREHGRDGARPRGACSSSRSAAAATATSRRTACGVVQDAGAYPGIGAILPGFTALMASGVYAIPKIEADTVSVVTNTTPIGPFRGAGRPEATQAIERAMDLFAAEIGHRPGRGAPPEPHPRPTPSRPRRPPGAATTRGDYERALDLALDTAGYAGAARGAARRRESGDTRALGIGVSVYVEITNGLVEPELGDVEITPDGEAILRTGSFSHGQGHETTFAMIVADRLGLPVESVRVIKGDTDEVAQGIGTYGSKSTQIGGVAARRGGARWSRTARASSPPSSSRRASTTSCSTRAAGGFHVVGSPTPVLSWKELARAAGRARGGSAELRAARDLQGRRADLPVRRARRRRRGRHRDRRGRAPASRRGRRRRHPHQPADRRGPGARRRRDRRRAGALRGVRLRRGGQPAHGELPRLRLPVGGRAALVGRRRDGDADAAQRARARRASASPGTIGATPAVQSAVVDALAPFGIRHVDMPVNGERVWRALRDAAASTAAP